MVSPGVFDGANLSEFWDKQPININLVEILEVSSISVISKFRHFEFPLLNFLLVCKRLTGYAGAEC